MKNLILLDFSLIERKGHNESYDFAVAYEALRQGIPVEIWCPKRNEGVQPDFVKECLHSRVTMKKWKDWDKIIIATLGIAWELRGLFKINVFKKDTLVLIPAIDHFFLFAFLLGTFRIKTKPKIVIILRSGLKSNYQKEYKCKSFVSVLRSLIHNIVFHPFLIKYLHKTKNVVFCSDSKLITEELRGCGLSEAVTLPIPHLPLKQEKKTINSDMIVGYFGGARFSKGFDLLPDIIKISLETHKNISFIIHAYIFEDSKQMHNAQREICEFKKLYPDKIEIIDKYLSTDEYGEMMKRCSIILIPCRKDFYGIGTSGIVAEAIACGAWAVVPSDTWMAAQKTKYDKIVVFENSQVETIIKALAFCIENEKNVDIEKINQQISNWYAFHSSANYFNILQSL